MKTVGDPTTIRLSDVQRVAVDLRARQAGLSRSEMVRRLLARAMGTPQPEASVTDAGGPRHRIRFVLPGVPDDASSEDKHAAAVRNTATIAGRCPDCDATIEVMDELPPAPIAAPAVKTSSSRPITGAVATKDRPAAPPRVTVRAEIRHRPTCPAGAA